MKKIFFIIFVLGTCLHIKAQTPLSDPVWNLVWSDEFDYNQSPNNYNWADQYNYLTNTKKWHLDNCYIWRDGNTEYTSNGNNMQLSNGGYISIKLDKLATPKTINYTTDCDGNSKSYTRTYSFSTGYLHLQRIVSQAYDMDFGFYEMKFRIPPAISNNNHRNRGIQTNWWNCCGVSQVEDLPNRANNRYQEIDFFEISGENNTVTHNFLSPTYADFRALGSGSPLIGANTPNFQEILDNKKLQFKSLSEYGGYYKLTDTRIWNEGDWHTIGIEVLPNTVNWYYDGKFVQTISNLIFAKKLRPSGDYEFPWNTHFPIISQSEMEIQVIPHEAFSARWKENNFNGNPDNNTIFPYILDIDYIRFYKHSCNPTSLPSLTLNAQFQSPFQATVYNTISMGTRNGVADIFSNDATVRVKDTFSADDGFEIPLGIEFYVDNCECEP